MNKKKIFSWEINLGHVLQIGAILMAVIIGWFTIEKRLSVVELKTGQGDKERTELREAQKTQQEALTMLVRQVDRLAIIVEKK